MSSGTMRPTDLLLASVLTGTAFLAAAGALALAGEFAGWGTAGWMALHLALLGGVSQLVIGVSQFFVTAFLATTPPPPKLVAAQTGCWSVGTVAVVTGVAADVDPAVLAGSALLLTTLGLYAAAISGLHRRSLQRAAWASRWYAASAAWLVPGIVAGVLLATGVAWPYGSLLGAHLAFNLGGWLGGAIVGTLHTFFPSLTRTGLRFGRLQPLTFLLWSAGVGSLAIGYGAGEEPLVLAGWALLLLASGSLSVNLVASAVAAPAGLTLPGRLVASAQVFLPLGVAFALLAALEHPLAPLAGKDQGVLAVLLVVGWIGLTVAGSMLHLISVVVHVRDLGRGGPKKDSWRDRAVSWLAVAGVALLSVARIADLDQLTGPALLLIFAAGLMILSSLLRSLVSAIRLGPGDRFG
ncbi:MAG TPA: hypothetical protein PKA56_02415 [Solirubrobacterales bacterium]|nr:hypothetical protein [Solirubrobacterales bacterium]